MKRNSRECKLHNIKSNTCNIRASAILPDGRVVILDVGKRKLKLVSFELTLISEWQLAEYPSEMCAVIEQIDCVYVCFSDKKQVHVHELKKGKYKLLYAVQTSFRPESFANIKKDTIVLSINRPCKEGPVASFEHFTLPGQPSTELIDGNSIADAIHSYEQVLT
ncbi:hypothetical protein DPMN_152586 [Dreissena polymorpha]|uniref:Uncharacterized protein n=1 Tax=Dreissena polymorpha TaxID=45954 RepID=A0A9D4J8H5_DREPO|nr:hypothetical protein DPMN_152586 [Dreissena polymorpha]